MASVTSTHQGLSADFGKDQGNMFIVQGIKGSLELDYFE